MLRSMTYVFHLFSFIHIDFMQSSVRMWELWTSVLKHETLMRILIFRAVFFMGNKRKLTTTNVRKKYCNKISFTYIYTKNAGIITLFTKRNKSITKLNSQNIILSHCTKYIFCLILKVFKILLKNYFLKDLYEYTISFSSIWCFISFGRSMFSLGNTVIFSLSLFLK